MGARCLAGILEWEFLNTRKETASEGADMGDRQEGFKSTVNIVSGLPRSGTSMMMQMLDAGGIEPLTDYIRKPDDDNPKGCLAAISASHNLTRASFTGALSQSTTLPLKAPHSM